MSYDGSNQFGWPMRPDRVEIVCDTAKAFAVSDLGKKVATESDSFSDYIACITWTIYGALAEQWPDTMVAEIQAGMAEADPACRASYGS